MAGLTERLRSIGATRILAALAREGKKPFLIAAYLVNMYVVIYRICPDAPRARRSDPPLKCVGCFNAVRHGQFRPANVTAPDGQYRQQ